MTDTMRETEVSMKFQFYCKALIFGTINCQGHLNQKSLYVSHLWWLGNLDFMFFLYCFEYRTLQVEKLPT